MNRSWLLPLLGLLVIACSFTSFLPETPTAVTPAFTPADTQPAPTLQTETITPTQPTPTYTSTPTYIYSGPTPTLSSTPQPTGTIGLLITVSATMAPLTGQILLTPGGPAFDSLTISGTQIYWGGSCKPTAVNIVTRTSNRFNINSVLLFTRLKDPLSDNSTDWNNGTDMLPDGTGNYTYSLTAKSIKYYQDFKMAWVQFQVVAVNKGNIVVGRTQLYLNTITITPCP